MVESWQISQPLYLRHLAIVQDTLLRGKSYIHVHYTYDNFKKLVKGGTGFWEAVKTVPDHLKIGNNNVASLDAKPDIDQYGFPKLDENQFHGPYNDATLAECASALNAGDYRPIREDPWLEKQSDGTFGKLVKIGITWPKFANLNVVIQNRSLKSLAPDRSEGSPSNKFSKKTSPSHASKSVEDVEAPPKFTFLTRQVNTVTRPVPLGAKPETCICA